MPLPEDIYKILKAAQLPDKAKGPTYDEWGQLADELGGVPSRKVLGIDDACEELARATGLFNALVRGVADATSRHTTLMPNVYLVAGYCAGNVMPFTYEYVRQRFFEAQSINGSVGEHGAKNSLDSIHDAWNAGWVNPIYELAERQP